MTSTTEAPNPRRFAGLRTMRECIELIVLEAADEAQAEAARAENEAAEWRGEA